MNQNQQTASIPESITIGGVTYLVRENPELQKFIQDVAKVEKTKLYSQFENLRSQIASLNGVQVTPDTPSVNVDDLVGKLKESFVTKETLTEILSQTINSTIKPLLDANEQNHHNALDEYRQKLIKDNEATCIPELVKGNSKEELDKALAESIRIRAAYPAPGAAPSPSPVHDPLIQQQASQQQASQQQAQGNKPDAAPQQTPQIPPAPPVPQRPAPDAGPQSSVKKMSMKDFAAKREALLQELNSTYGGGNSY